ncbi:hypothetical protein RclHR1_02340010 [Rhizophagus clarus]|uniref:Uncharacterized protein n=1 Tax=Rhizophagus clarus TaxID=94130 RepID=A0A2Z6QVM4_9GLOM|nr:hypothetical protein RclHR1_02340010 [Rhizophagus clarus]GET00299.1 hypothetical protein GLOIN_2v1762188 [Rhizophagus clarus]
MSNVHILNDIKDRECGSYKKPSHRLGSAYEQELEKKLRSVTEFNSEINDLSEKLVDKYNKREKESQQTYADIGNKISQLNTSIKYSAEIKSLKSNIKTLKREATLIQKASFADKIKILSLEAKVCELEGKLDDLELEQAPHDSNAVKGFLEELVQINSFDPKEIDSLRLELEQVKEDLNSKNYEIKYIEKGIEASDNIYKWELDIWSSERLKLIEENSSLRNQLALKKDNEVEFLFPLMNHSSQLGHEGIPSALNPSSQIISVGGAEVMPLPATAPITTSSLISPMLIYSILTLVLIAIIWFMIRKYWNSQKKSNTEYSPNQNYFLSSLGISEVGLYDPRTKSLKIEIEVSWYYCTRKNI